MRTSTSVFLTDILPKRRKLFNNIVKNKLFNQTDSTKVFSSLKSSGVEGIELLLPSYNTITTKDIQDVQTILKENNMPVFSVHQVLRFFTKTQIAEITELFFTAHILEAKVIVLHLNCAAKQIFSQEYVETLHKLEKKFNITIGFENREKHIASFMAVHTWNELEFSKLMLKTGFHITLGTTHLGQTGGDIINFFKKHKEKIINIHLGDYKHHPLNSTLRPMRYKHLPLGKGELPIQELLTTLQKEKYQGLVTMEIHTNLEGMCESAKIIKKFSTAIDL